MSVVDASVVVTALLDAGASGTVARRAMARAADLWAPTLMDAEVFSAVRGRWLGKQVDTHDADTALADLLTYPITRYEITPLLPRAWALRSNLTIYDALYVALADLLDDDLITADGRIAGAPSLPCRVTVLRSS